MGKLWKMSVTALAIGMLIVGSGVASAIPAPVAPKVDPQKASPGDTVTISGEGCLVSEPEATSESDEVPVLEATVKVADWKPVTATVLESGAWSVKVKVPDDAKAGKYKVAATCDLYNDAFPYPEASLEVVVKEPAEPAEPEVSTDVDTVAAGGALTVSARGYDAGEQVSVTLFSDPVKLGEMTADAKGEASALLTIPADAAAGAHRIEGKGLSSDKVASTDITVTESAASPAAPPTGTEPDATNNGSLAFTGSSAFRLGFIGVIAALVGSALLMIRRRRIA